MTKSMTTQICVVMLLLTAILFPKNIQGIFNLILPFKKN